MTNLVLQGSGGGGKKGGAGGGSREAPNNLRSNAVVRFIAVVSEGVIGGLVGGAQGIYLDGQPIQSTSGNFSYKGIRVDERIGLPSQSHVAGFSSIENTVTLGLQVKYGEPITRTTTDDNIDAVRIIFGFPVFHNVNTKSGEIAGARVEIKLESRAINGGAWEDRGTLVVDGKNSSGFQKAARVARPTAPGKWEFRATRLTSEATLSDRLDESFIDSYVEIVESVNPYNNTAYYACTVDTAQFGGNVPRVSFDIDGIEVAVPSNYNPDALGTVGANVYSGVWDGTFKYMTTNNPIWNLYDALTNDRYGCGQPPEYVDKFALYEAARYCDAVDDNGNFVGVPNRDKSGFRPRFTFRTQFTTQDDALALLSAIVSSCRGQVYWGAGAVQISMDRPKDAVKIFDPSNVEDGLFEYGTTASSERFLTVNTSYNEPDDNFDVNIVQYKNANKHEANGIEYITDITKMGCADVSEAYMFGQWYSDTSTTQIHTVSFVAGLEGRAMRPGDRFDVMDPRVSGSEWGGRVKSISGQTVTLDHPVDLQGGVSYTFVTIAANGQTIARKRISASSTGSGRTTLTLTDSVGTMSIVDRNGVTVTVPEISPDHNWLISGNIEPTAWTVVAVKQIEDFKHEIMGVNYDPTKFARVEQGVILPPPDYSGIEYETGTPTDLQAKVRSIADPIYGIRNDMDVLWKAPAGKQIFTYKITWRRNNGPWQSVTTTEPGYTIERVYPGVYEFYVYAYSITGVESAPATATYNFNFEGATDLDGVLNLRVVGGSDPTTFTSPDCVIAWDDNPQWETANNKPAAFKIKFFNNNADRALRAEYQIAFDRKTVTYTKSENASQGLVRDFIVEVSVVDGGQRESFPTELTAKNPAPPMLTGIQVLGGYEFYRLTHNDPVNVPDHVGTIIWHSKTSGFEPGPSTRAYTGTGTFHDVEAEKDTGYYVRAAAYDTFGEEYLNISSEYYVETVNDEITYPQPDVPTGLVLTATAKNGVVSLTAKWDELGDGTYETYEVAISETNQLDGSFLGGFITGTNSYVFTSVTPNTTYYVKVRARNDLKMSNYSQISTILTPAADGTGGVLIVPTAPSALVADPSFRNVSLSWKNGTGTIGNTEVYEGTTNSFSAPTTRLLGAVGAGETTYLRGGLTTGVTRYYWVRHTGAAGSGPTHPGTSSGLAATTIALELADYQNLSIVGAKIANATIDDAKIVELSANKLKAGSVISGSVLVGSEPISKLNTIEEGADVTSENTSADTAKVAGTDSTTVKNNAELGAQNPATRINANTTLIHPGKIQLQGGTTLTSWLNGGDNTLIEGGKIATNSIKTNSLVVGARGIDMAGISFTPDKSTNRLSWSAGSISYTGDNGATVTTNISAGSVQWNVGEIWVGWIRGNTTLSTSTARDGITPVDLRFMIGVYRGGYNFVQNYGGTVIDGDQIQTGTIKGNRIEANSIGAAQVTTTGLITNQAQINTGIINTAHIQDAQITTAKIRDAQITGAKIANATITMANIGQLTVTNAHIGDATLAGEKLVNGAITDVWVHNRSGALGQGTSKVCYQTILFQPYERLIVTAHHASRFATSIRNEIMYMGHFIITLNGNQHAGIPITGPGIDNYACSNGTIAVSWTNGASPQNVEVATTFSIGSGGTMRNNNPNEGRLSGAFINDTTSMTVFRCRK